MSKVDWRSWRTLQYFFLSTYESKAITWALALDRNSFAASAFSYDIKSCVNCLNHLKTILSIFATTSFRTFLSTKFYQLTADAPLSSAALERTIARSETASRILLKQSASLYGKSGSLEISWWNANPWVIRFNGIYKRK